MVRAWIPWLILSVFVFAWGFPTARRTSWTGKTTETITVDGQSQAEGAATPSLKRRDSRSRHCTNRSRRSRRWWPSRPRKAPSTTLNWLSATGSGIFLAAIVAGLFMGYSIRGLFRQYWETIKLVQILVAHHRRDAGAGIRDALLRHGRDDGPGLRPHRACSIRSSGRCSAGWAWR